MDDPGTSTPLQRALLRKQELWNERSSWVEHWRELVQTMQPRAGRFFGQQTNRGEKRHNDIIDETATYALRTLAAGMMSGVTSPARPWFRLTLSDKALMESGRVKQWLHAVELLLRDVFAASNTYRTFHAKYRDLGLIGTSATIVLPDFDNVLHNYHLPTGEFAVATDYRGRVDTLVREFHMTVGQLVGQFTLEKCSFAVQQAWRSGKLNQYMDVVHIIEPRAHRDLSKPDARNMRWSSCYFEPAHCSEGKYLRESGFKRFPALCPRWDVTGNDAYGNSPAMDVLGSNKQLQHQQLRKGQGIDYMVNPPLQVPTALKNQATNRLPGGITYVDTTGPNNSVRSLYDVRIDMQHLLMDIVDVRERIKTGSFADLFLMLANDTRSGITATEVAERHEEKLLMLGPVLERLDNELLKPAIDLAFDYAADAGILPDAPEEMQGMQIDVEFVSVLHQAQRIVAAAGTDRLLGTVSQIAAGKGDMSVWDKIDTDQVVDEYADMFGANPKIIVPDDVVAQIRADRAKAIQAQQAAAAAPQAVDSAKTASEIDTGNLQDVMQGLMGYSTPA